MVVWDPMKMVQNIVNSMCIYMTICVSKHNPFLKSAISIRNMLFKPQQTYRLLFFKNIAQRNDVLVSMMRC